jgi:two-component sensor histidine kinase/PAS domain-containing protein
LLLLLPVAAMAVPLLVLGVGAVMAWRSAWGEATAEMERTADAAAEYVLRVLEGHRAAVDRVNEALVGLSDAEIQADEAALRDRVRSLIGSMPLLATSFVIARDGHPLLSASTFPVSHDIDFSDREYFQALARDDAPALHVSRVLIGRLDNALFFAIGRRREGAGNGRSPGEFDGLINVSGDPNRPARGFEAFRRDAGDTVTLIRSDGEVLARSPGFDRPLAPFPPSSSFHAAVASGAARATYQAGSSVDGVERLFAIRRVGDLPLWASANRSRMAVVGRWRAVMLGQSAIALPAALALLALSLLVVRAQRRLALANADLETRVAERSAALAAREERLRLAIEAGQLSAWEFDLATGRGSRAGPLAAEIPTVPPRDFPFEAWLEAIHPEDRDRVERQFWAVARDEAPRFEVEFRTGRPDGAWVWLSSFGAVVEREGGTGRPRRIAGVAQDISRRKAAEERQALLSREVDHRAKNALSVVLAALRLTRAPTRDDYVRAVVGRVAAIARAQTILAGESWAGADLRTLLRGEVAPFLPEAGREGPCLALDGPDLALPPQAAQPLAMAFHELATNSVKYGALSVAEGRLSVTWGLEAQSRGGVTIRWVESGGPPVEAPPAAKGFGTRVLEATIKAQLGGEVRMQWLPAGLACTISIPLHGAAAEPFEREGALA